MRLLLGLLLFAALVVSLFLLLDLGSPAAGVAERPNPVAPRSDVGTGEAPLFGEARVAGVPADVEADGYLSTVWSQTDDLAELEAAWIWLERAD